MSFTIPLLINKVTSCDLPVSLYKDVDFELLLSEFPVSAREQIFELRFVEIADGSCKYKRDVHAISSLPDKFPEFVSSAYRIVALVSDHSNETIQLFNNKISWNLNFCCQLFFDYPITLTIFGDDKMSKTQHSIQSFKRKSIKVEIDNEKIESFKNTLFNCLEGATITTKKKGMLHSLLNVANLQTFNAGLTCATYITILESLFTDENTEITYRFAMRLTKYLNKDLSFFKTIKKLYAKRSSYYHTGEVKFTYDEEVYLSTLTRQIIIEYIQSPRNFDVSKLDEQLLL
jgi:hypothetical protein